MRKEFDSPRVHSHLPFTINRLYPSGNYLTDKRSGGIVRKMENETAPKKSSMSPMMIGGIILVVIVLLGVVFYAARSSKKAAQTGPAPEKSETMQQPSPSTAMQEGSKAEEKTEGAVKSFEIDGSNFKFTPNTISVNEGDMVKITFKNTEGFHNFRLDEFNAKSKTISSGQSDELSFVAGKKGTFQFYCAVGNHRAMGMVGTLTVN